MSLTRCLVCGGTLEPHEGQTYTYQGLPGVRLRNVTIWRCPQCGEEEVAIPDLEGLHRALMERLVSKPQRLTGVEVRFLRKFLGWSGEDLARHMGVRPETVSRWEHEEHAMSTTAERLLRLMAHTYEPVRDYIEHMAQMASLKAAPQDIVLSAGPEGWSVPEVA